MALGWTDVIFQRNNFEAQRNYGSPKEWLQHMVEVSQSAKTVLGIAKWPESRLFWPWAIEPKNVVSDGVSRLLDVGWIFQWKMNTLNSDSQSCYSSSPIPDLLQMFLLSILIYSGTKCLNLEESVQINLFSKTFNYEI